MVEDAAQSEQILGALAQMKTADEGGEVDRNALDALIVKARSALIE